MFNLEATLFSGQAFGWKKEQSTYQAVLDGRVINLSIADPFKTISTDPFLYHYFDCAYPYDEAEAFLAKKDVQLSLLIKDHGSLHILNQDPWQTMISFITSQNNTIRRIRHLLDVLSKTYGHELEAHSYSFPQPQTLLQSSDEAALRALGFGYRAPFLLAAAKKADLLEDICHQDDETALKTLQQIPGIGPKVASCLLLFGFGRKNLFPLDTWTKKIMATSYPKEEPSIFSPYQGIAQQHLFYHERRKIGAHW